MSELWYFDCLNCGTHNVKRFDALSGPSHGSVICNACNYKDPLPSWELGSPNEIVTTLEPSRQYSHSPSRHYSSHGPSLYREKPKNPLVVFQDNPEVERLAKRLRLLESEHKETIKTLELEYEEKEQTRRKELENLKKMVKILVLAKEKRATKKTRELETWLTDNTIRLNELADEIGWKWQNK